MGLGVLTQLPTQQLWGGNHGVEGEQRTTHTFMRDLSLRETPKEPPIELL